MQVCAGAGVCVSRSESQRKRWPLALLAPGSERSLFGFSDSWW